MSACIRVKVATLLGFDVVVDMTSFSPFRGRTIAVMGDPARSTMLRAGVPFVSLPSQRHSGADLKFAALGQKIVIVDVDFLRGSKSLGTLHLGAHASARVARFSNDKYRESRAEACGFRRR